VFFGSGIASVAVWLVGAAVLAGPAVAVTMLDAAEVSPASASLAGGVGVVRPSALDPVSASHAPEPAEAEPR